MNFSKKLNLVIFRFREKGLEIFLENQSDDLEEGWNLPCSDGDKGHDKDSFSNDDLIELDPVQQENGEEEEAWAVEGDWHDIPSLKSMLYEDAMFLKDKMETMEKGAYFKIKEAFKKVLPHQYKFLKELKDILMDRNSIKDL